jgi:hypothetical protein
MSSNTGTESTVRILHLSDIHFGLRRSKDPKTGDEITRSAHHFVSTRAGVQVPDPKRLSDMLTEVSAAPPTVLVVSGDVGWSGAQDDYNYASNFVKRLRSHWPDTNLVIAAGNHDVDLSDAVATDERQSAFTQFVKAIYGKNFDNTYPFFKWPPARKLKPREKLVSFHAVGDHALFVSVNSAAYIDDREKHGVPIYVSMDLLRLITQYLSSAPFKKPRLRVFVMHHHLLPFADPRWGNSVDYSAPPSEPDPTIVANSAALQAWLARTKFDIVLHGHKHMAHGRSDRLWRRSQYQTQQQVPERHTLIVGAGTAGVSDDQIPRQEGLSLNEIGLVRIDLERWHATVQVRGLFPDEPGRPTQDLFAYSVETGEEPPDRPELFVSSTMDLCHQAIAQRCRDQPGLRNFISVVTSAKFVLPRQTARIGEHAVSQEQIENCFLTLHPEYDVDTRYGWGKEQLVRDRLQAVPRRFAFQHGPRMFGIPGRVEPAASTPAGRALALLDLSPTRGYLSLINTDTDVLGEVDRQPLPGLVGVQFIRHDGQLDIISTFRSIELSFWWVVNMYEAGKLLEWAAKKKGLSVGTITCFAPYAEWRKEPHPSFRTRIDELSVSKLANLALGTAPSELKRLIELLEEKIRHTSVFDLDSKGLQNLADLLSMRVALEGDALLHDMAKDLVKELKHAVGEIEHAMQSPRDRNSHVDVAIEDLSRICNKLRARYNRASAGRNRKGSK